MKFVNVDVGFVFIAVAPFTGAWIEMSLRFGPAFLKWIVAPFTGAWIEMVRGMEAVPLCFRRTLHGCVD